MTLEHTPANPPGTTNTALKSAADDYRKMIVGAATSAETRLIA